MPVTNYHTLNGRIRGETASGTRTNYLTDALGSITATVNSSAAVVNTYRHKPYGKQLAKTGVGADPKYLWTGDTGSRKTGRSHAEQYNDHRHLGTTQGQWTTVDMLWPRERSYGYVGCNPVGYIDPSGLKGVRCACAGRNTGVMGYPKNGKYYECFLAVCKAFCPPPDPFTAAERACTTIPNCREINQSWLACNKGSGHAWEECGKFFTVPGGGGWNGSGGNYSNYPKPIEQIGGGNCCVECKMRVCCEWYDILDQWELNVQRGFAKCRRQGSF